MQAIDDGEVNANANLADNSDSEEEEPITAKKVLDTLESTWINEKFAPEILTHQSDMLDLMLGQICHMEENLEPLDKNDFRLIAHKMELERIKYIIASYLRCRLRKIEQFTKDIKIEEDKRPEKRLTPNEHQFAESLLENTKSLFYNLVLKHMPSNLQEETAKETIKPNVMRHVFLKANVNVNSVIVGVNDEEVDLQAGSRHIMPYQLAADLINDGRVQLI